MSSTRGQETPDFATASSRSSPRATIGRRGRSSIGGGKESTAESVRRKLERSPLILAMVRPKRRRLRVVFG